MKRNTFILSVSYSSHAPIWMVLRKRGVTFLTCFRKRGYPETGGSLRKGGGEGVPALEETMVLVNNPTFLREAITAYVGTQDKSDTQRKRRSNSTKYGSFATDINHHQPEVQDKCILCYHKHNLDNCEEYIMKSIEERSKFLAWKKLCYGCYKPISISHNAITCNNRQICQICKKKHPTGLHGYTPKQKAGDDNSSALDGKQNVTFKINCAKFDDVSCIASCSDEIVNMYIVPVKIRYVNKRKEVIKYALLVNCSQGTLVREDIIHKLEAPRARTKITVKAMNGG